MWKYSVKIQRYYLQGTKRVRVPEMWNWKFTTSKHRSNLRKVSGPLRDSPITISVTKKWLSFTYLPRESEILSSLKSKLTLKFERKKKVLTTSWINCLPSKQVTSLVLYKGHRQELAFTKITCFKNLSWLFQLLSHKAVQLKRPMEVLICS